MIFARLKEASGKLPPKTTGSSTNAEKERCLAHLAPSEEDGFPWLIPHTGHKERAASQPSLLSG